MAETFTPAKVEKPTKPKGPTDSERLDRLEQGLAELTRRTEGLAPRLGKYAALNAIFAERKEAVEAADAAPDPESVQ